MLVGKKAALLAPPRRLVWMSRLYSSKYRLRQVRYLAFSADQYREGRSAICALAFD